MHERIHPYQGKFELDKKKGNKLAKEFQRYHLKFWLVSNNLPFDTAPWVIENQLDLSKERLYSMILSDSEWTCHFSIA